MFASTQELRPMQGRAGEMESISIDRPVDLVPPHAVMMPDDFYALSPEDQTVNAACLYARRNGFSVDEQTRRFVILSVWESGACSGAEAHGALLTEGLLDFDVLMGMYAGYVRALSRGETV
jgi:hypothetical protein